MKITKADLQEDGTVRLVARDERLDLETWIVACTDGEHWVYERSTRNANHIAAGEMPATVGRRIRHKEWELTNDA